MTDTLIAQDTLQKLINFFSLQQQQIQPVKLYLKTAKIQKLMIRDILSQQGKSSKRSYFLLQGHVNITSKLSNGERVVLHQIVKQQPLNFQIILTNWINKYSIIVSSSYASFLVFQEKDIKMITIHIHKQLQDKIAMREKDVNKRNRKLRQEERKKKMQDNINKLILPQINLATSKKKNSLLNVQSHYTQQIASIKNLPIFSSKEGIKSSRSSSLKKIKAPRYSQPHTFDKKSLQAQNQHLLEHLHQYKSKFLQNKLQRLKSQKSFTSNQREIKQIDYSRNQKLFKQQLKSIVKRKLLFERKHFKILANFKNDPKKGKQEQQEGTIRKYEDQNPIDNYFIL